MSKQQILVKKSFKEISDKIYKVYNNFILENVNVWPATVPRGGIKQGVLLGFWYGNKINDEDKYLTHGTNKQIFYKIYKSPEEINEAAIVKLLHEAVETDMLFAKRKKCYQNYFKDLKAIYLINTMAVLTILFLRLLLSSRFLNVPHE